MMTRSPLSVGRLVPLLAAGLLSALPAHAQDATSDDAARWERRAQNVTVTRDDWGIPHVYGETDADAVFGLMYAQAEDDFNRVETNYLGALGRLAEAEGESAIYRDLRMKLFHEPDSLRVLYEASPPWLRELMNAWADGLNYYLHTHPEVTPRVIRRFKPWMHLAFSEGSISNDITRLHGPELQAFYEGHVVMDASETGDTRFREPDGSNAIAIAPQKTVNGNALLLINPHTSFYFRTEVHVTSGEGLNAYGAATWGQFFIYQGFNERLGWAHTTSGVDAIDEYLETVTERDGRLYYRYGDEERAVATSAISIPYRTENGGMAERTFTVYRTHRGPIVREQDGKWVSVALMRKPVEALSQSFGRMKARDLGSFMEVMALEANSSNNTIYADADGNIAYMPPQFIPRRDDRFDFSEPVDGSDPATDWNGLHALDETPHVQNPASGWIQNTNNWPYSVAGEHSPDPEDYPRYMDTFGENPRGVHAIRLLQDRNDFSLQSLIDAAYDPYQPGFALMLPALVEAYDETPDSHVLKGRLAEQIGLLRGWDYRWGVGSIATSLAVQWMDELVERVGLRPPPGVTSLVQLLEHLANSTTTDLKLEALATASDRLEAEFGSWRTPWGEINRFQRLTGGIEQSFSDQAPSVPVGFTGSWTGSLAVFGTRSPEGTQRRYGVGGNTFVAVVEFGERVRARAIRAGGQSGDPASPHFDDQAERYATGDLRDVYFYRSDLEGHIEREYRPGDELGGEVPRLEPLGQSLPRAEPNDQRTPAGRMVDGELRIELEAREAEWYPRGPDGPRVVTPAFAEVGRPPQVPGPLIRAPAGTRVHVTIRNALSRPIAVRGLVDQPAGLTIVNPDGERTRLARRGEGPVMAQSRSQNCRQPPNLDDGWTTAAAEDLGLACAPLVEMTEAIRRDDYRNVHAVLVAKDGRLVYEEYFTGTDRRPESSDYSATLTHTFDRNTLHTTRSAGKSFTSALVGVALASGAIPSVEQPVLEFFPELADVADAAVREITLEHVLTMSAGFDWNEGDVPYTNPANHERALSESDEPARFVLSREVVAEPGSRWDYNSGLSTLLGLVIHRVTGQAFGAYAREHLFAPLGIQRVDWTGPPAWADHPAFIWNGDEPWRMTRSTQPAGSLWLLPRDMLKFGQLYQDGGRWNGRQVLPENWVAASLEPRVPRSRRPIEYPNGAVRHAAYGYQWWYDRVELPYGDVTVHSASGNGGQKIWVLPELGVTAVHLAGNYNLPGNGWEAERLLLERIVPWAIGVRSDYRHQPSLAPVTVDPEQWPLAMLPDAERARYPGSYRLDGQSIEIRELDDRLQLLPPIGMGPLDLIPQGDHVFVLGLVEDGEVRRIFTSEERYVFVFDEGGRAVRFEIRGPDGVIGVGERVR